MSRLIPEIMKPQHLILLIFLLISGCSQSNEIIPDLTTTNNPELWNLQNRELVPGEEIYLDANEGDGLLWMKGSNFSNGKIELDIKGKDERGKSFVGLAFHGLNDSTYDVVYFRPFNFMSPERKGHSVQYISHPEYPWYKLRAAHPEKYENPVSPVPNPDDWLHATIIVSSPTIKVFVNNSETPSLVVDQLSTRKEGWIGFWVGNGSDGSFKNLKITKE